MAASLIFGLSTGTLLILILVPVFYAMYGRALKAMKIEISQDPFDEGGIDSQDNPQPSFVARKGNPIDPQAI